MTNNEISVFKRMQLPPKREGGIFARLRRLDVHELSEYGILFLLCRIFLFGAINPFGLAYFAATFPKQKKVYGIVFVCLGIIAGNFGILSLKYLGSAAIIITFSLLMGEELAKRRWLYGLIAALSVSINGLIYVFFNGFLLYDTFMLVTEGAATFLCFLAFDRAVILLRSIKSRNVFENEETLSLVLLAASFILSISTIPYLSGAAHILSALIIMIFSLTSGPAVSVMAGTLLGLVISTADVLPAQVIGVYALCAMVSGLLRRYGKWGVSAGFLFTNAAVMVYFNSSTITFITYYYIIAAAVVLFFLPESFLSLFGAVARTPGLHPFGDPVARTKEILDEKLEESAASFEELSALFKNFAEDKVNTDLRNAEQVYEKTAEKVCKNCSMNRYCWQKNYHATLNMLADMFPIMQERGYAADIDVPKKFQEDCLRFEDFLASLNRNYEIYKVNLMWAGKVLESRNLVADQFQNIASILNNIRSRLRSDISENMILENKIAASLDRKGITAGQICVTNADGYEVTMQAAACGGNLICSTTAAAAVSEVLGVPMLRTDRSCGEKVCRLRFREQERFAVEIGLAQAVRDNAEMSGDNYTNLPLKDGKYVLALSDGMGSGSRACMQSSIAVELIKRLLGAGFDKDTSLRFINSILLANTEEESFATVDMCLINLYTGALEFIKIGSACSYIKSQDSIVCVPSTSLPAGIIEHPDPDRELRYALNGDFVVLATDGVTDALNAGEEDRMSQILSGYTETSPQTLADNLLLEAIRLSGGKVQDDMTVLCARISEAM